MTAHEIAADRSPSLISLMRAPFERISSISPSWRGRSRQTTVRSPTLRPSAAAIRPRFSDGDSRMSTWPGSDRTDAQLLEVRVGGVQQAAAFSDAASMVIALARPMRNEVRALERIDGDVDLRLAGHADAHLLADVEHRRLVALAFADDDLPWISTSSNVRRIASTAARSAAIRSPRPMNRADAMAAASVTRTISSASSVSMELRRRPSSQCR